MSIFDKYENFDLAVFCQNMTEHERKRFIAKRRLKRIFFPNQCKYEDLHYCYLHMTADERRAIFGKLFETYYTSGDTYITYKFSPSYKHSETWDLLLESFGITIWEDKIFTGILLESYQKAYKRLKREIETGEVFNR